MTTEMSNKIEQETTDELESDKIHLSFIHVFCQPKARLALGRQYRTLCGLSKTLLPDREEPVSCTQCEILYIATPRDLRICQFCGMG